MSGLSVHAVDVAGGRPAAGMGVRVYRLGDPPELVAEGLLNESGLLDHPIARRWMEPGLYEVVFAIGAFYGRPDGFLDEAPFRFRLSDPAQHYHLPLKVTPWGYSLFRGS